MKSVYKLTKPYLSAAFLCFAVLLAGCGDGKLFSPEENTVRQLFMQTVKHEPSKSELDYFVKQLKEGKSEAEIQEEIRVIEKVRREEQTEQIKNESPNEYEVVRKVFRDLLEREPSPSALKFFIKQLKDGKTEMQIRAHIMNTPEYVRKKIDKEKGKSGKNAQASTSQQAQNSQPKGELLDFNNPVHRERAESVKRAFRELLGRDPDPKGYYMYLEWRMSGKTDEDVRNHIKQSREYLNKHK